MSHDPLQSTYTSGGSGAGGGGGGAPQQLQVGMSVAQALAGPPPSLHGPAPVTNTGGGSGGGMIQLLPSSAGPVADRPQGSPASSASAAGGGAAASAAHARSQSQFVPMHSPSASFDSLASMQLAGMTGQGRVAHGGGGHVQQAQQQQQQTQPAPQAQPLPSANLGPALAGVVATTPSPASVSSLFSPTAASSSAADSTYSYPARSDGYDVFA